MVNEWIADRINRHVEQQVNERRNEAVRDRLNGHVTALFLAGALHE